MDAYHLNNDVDVAKRFLYSIPFKELKNKHLEVNPALVEFADKLENKYVMLLPEESSSLQEVATRNSYKEVVAFNIEYQLESFSTIEGNEIVVSALSPDRVYQTMKYVLAQHNIRLYEFGGIGPERRSGRIHGRAGRVHACAERTAARCAYGQHHRYRRGPFDGRFRIPFDQIGRCPGEASAAGRPLYRNRLPRDGRHSDNSLSAFFECRHGIERHASGRIDRDSPVQLLLRRGAQRKFQAAFF